MRRRLLPVFVTVLSMAFAPAPFPRPLRGDLKAMQGKWEQVRCFFDGGESQPAPGERMVAMAGMQQTRMHKGQVIRRCQLTLDLSKEPKWATLRGDGGTSLGIYKLDGDSLTFCWDMAGRGRPTGFGNRKGVLVEVLKRRKR